MVLGKDIWFFFFILNILEYHSDSYGECWCYYNTEHREYLRCIISAELLFRKVKSIRNVILPSKFLSTAFQLLISNPLAVERWQCCFQAVCSSKYQTRPSQPYMSKAANFPVVSLFLYPSIQLLLAAIATFALWLRDSMLVFPWGCC